MAREALVYVLLDASVDDRGTAGCSGSTGREFPLTYSTQIRAFLVNSIRYPWDIIFL